MSNTASISGYARREQVGGASPSIADGTTSSPSATPRAVKEMLNTISGTPLSPTDSWDPQSVVRLRAFQSSELLPATGLVDDATMARLERRVQERDVGDTANVAGHDAPSQIRQLTPSEHADATAHVEALLESFLHASTDVAHTLFHDAPTRAAYIAECSANAKSVLAQVANGQMLPKEAAQIAVAWRNEALIAARGGVSDFGLAVSRALKETGKTYPELVAHYASTMYGKPAAALTEAEGTAVLMKIVERSGATNPTVNAMTRLGPTAGKLCIALSIALAIYHIANADDKVRETAKQGAAIAGGFVGFKVGGAVGALVCGPPCAIVGALVGLVAGALAAEHAADVAVVRIRA